MILSRRAVLGGAAGLAGVAALPAWAKVAERFAAPTRELMVPVPGGRVYVRVNGDLAARRPPLVLIHGGPGGSHGYMLGALALADERAVILYDQLDSGQSDRPGDPANWTVARFVDELEPIRAALGIARWHVCGHSWGGTIALEYGAREYGAGRPAALAGLVLASPLVSTRSWIADADVLRTRLPRDVRETLLACDRAPLPPAAACERATDAFYAAFNWREPPGAAMRAYLADPRRATNRTLYRTMWGGSEFVATGSLRDYDGEPLLARLDGRRTLFVVGQHDEARPETALSFALRVPGSEVAVLPGAAHDTFGDRSAETIATLRGWLARHDAG